MSFQKRDSPDSRSVGGNIGKGHNKANGAPANFRTDAAISSSRAGRERPLQPWVAPAGSEGADMTLEKPLTGRTWDQFAANERQFGITSTYDENIYTTPINKAHPQYKERLARAEKAAKEIEGSAALTAHHAEERQMDFTGGNDNGGDEEANGVKRQDFPALGNRETKYTPPARRAPTGASTVKGAPIDPAIISSQLRAQKPQPGPKQDNVKVQAIGVAGPPPSYAEVSMKSSALSTKAPEPPAGGKVESSQMPGGTEPTNQVATPSNPATATSGIIPSQKKDAPSAAPSATATVERDVLKHFKNFAQQQRETVEKTRSSKAKADKEVKLIELKKFADSFKLPTPVPQDLIGIIAKDPAKQREIQEKANRDAIEVAKRKAEEAAAKEKKQAANTAAAPQSTTTTVPSVESKARTTNTPSGPGSSTLARGQGGRGPSSYYQSRPQHIPTTGRQGGLSHRIRESQKAISQEQRMPPTGPANAMNTPFNNRMPGQFGPKLNPNSHEFRPGAFAAGFTPNPHPSAGSSPRSGMNHANGPLPVTAQPNVPIMIGKKGRVPNAKKCNIFDHAKSIQPPETKNWSDNGGLRPSYDTPPTWRSVADDEKSDSTMHLSCDEYFERHPFDTQPTPNPPHLLPQHMHQQLPLHMQHGHNVGPRHSPHAPPPVQMHNGGHPPGPHGPFNGHDDHTRMMHSNSSQSFSSPRMGYQVMYSAGIHSTPQPGYSQHMMPAFMGPGTPQMNNFNRSLSNNGQFVPQPAGSMGPMMQPHFMAPGMVAAGPPMHMYAGQPFIPQGGAPQPMATTAGFPSPGRPAAPMMVPGGSSQGQVMYAQSPSMQYQQPYAPQQGQINNIRSSYNGAGSQQYGSSPQQMHQYAGPPNRNGNNNYNKNFQGHNQQHGPNAHAAPTGPQGRASEGPDEAK
ncbi:hypothetical protein GGS20DRAFT_582368 [Poronia punctata]|nr:hypothetical protein GGS20DRAFT_582368 [Poronia punctata]